MIKQVSKLKRHSPTSKEEVHNVIRSLSKDETDDILLLKMLEDSVGTTNNLYDIKEWTCIRESLIEKDYDTMYIFPENWGIWTIESWNIIHVKKGDSLQEIVYKLNLDTVEGETVHTEEWEIL